MEVVQWTTWPPIVVVMMIAISTYLLPDADPGLSTLQQPSIVPLPDTSLLLRIICVLLGHIVTMNASRTAINTCIAPHTTKFGIMSNIHAMSAWKNLQLQGNAHTLLQLHQLISRKYGDHNIYLVLLPRTGESSSSVCPMILPHLHVHGLDIRNTRRSPKITQIL